jgi:diaminopimelate decarboxylase
LDHFTYKDGLLHAEDVPLTEIAAAVGTPFYCYSTATMVRHYQVLEESLSAVDPLICYAVKANSNQSVIRTMLKAGAGMDVISGGELMRVLAAGARGDQVVFAGPGKTNAELSLALDNGIYQFNVESEPELRNLSDIATSKGLVAPVAIRINPNVDAGTHEKISTGRKQDKFGIGAERAAEIYALGRELPGIDMLGVALHIGSQITSLAPFEAAFSQALELIGELRALGHDIRRLNLGGGLGIRYADEKPPTPAEYGAMVERLLAGQGLEIALEPGRMIIGNAGILVASVIYEKHEGRRFVILDSAMNDLIRPSLYDGWHGTIPVNETGDNAAWTPSDLVGPICESGDFLAKGRDMPPLAQGDLIAVRTAGAYGAVMGSTYNTRPLLPEVLVNGDKFAVVRERQTVDDLIAQDRIPEWLEDAGT